MSIYDSNSRYFKCDTDNDLPQDNMTKSKYTFDTTVVTSKESGRLDLVSYRVYNTPVNWWIIARFNGIINPTSVVAGTRLKIPRL